MSIQDLLDPEIEGLLEQIEADSDNDGIVSVVVPDIEAQTQYPRPTVPRVPPPPPPTTPPPPKR